MKQAGSRAAPARMNSHSPWVSAGVETQAGANPTLSDASFAAVFDTSAEALLVINAKGSIQRANRRAAELLGSDEDGLR
jgi:PAS domain-containing protein